MYKQKRLLISSLIIPSKRKATETTKDTNNKKAIVVKIRMSHPRACERRDLKNTGSKMKRTTLDLFTEEEEVEVEVASIK